MIMTIDFILSLHALCLVILLTYCQIHRRGQFYRAFLLGVFSITSTKVLIKGKEMFTIDDCYWICHEYIFG